MTDQKPSDAPPDLTSLWQEHWGLGDELGKLPDLTSLWQSAMGEWAQGFEKLARGFTTAGHELWAQTGADLPEWQNRWRSAVDQYEERAKPIQQEMVKALRELLASWPEPAKPIADAMIQGVEQGLEAERHWLDTLKTMATEADEGSPA